MSLDYGHRGHVIVSELSQVALAKWADTGSGTMESFGTRKSLLLDAARCNVGTLILSCPNISITQNLTALAFTSLRHCYRAL